LRRKNEIDQASYYLEKKSAYLGRRIIMRYLILVGIVLLTMTFSVGVNAQDNDTLNNFAEIYPWIIGASAGPIIWDTINNTGQFYRLIITESEIYDNLYLEIIMLEDEGAAKKVIEHYMFPFELFKCDQETSKINIRKWIDYDQVKISVGTKNFMLYLKPDLGKTVLVETE
jgi:hypothetical protein